MLNPACKNDCDIDSLWTCLPYPSGEATVPWEIPKSIITIIINIYVASAAVAVYRFQPYDCVITRFVE